MNEHVMKSYAAFAQDQKIRQSGSSGGMFTVLSNWIFSHNGIVVGAAFDESHVVHHVIAHNAEELKPLQGSKYVQSEIGKVYQETRKHLANGCKVLFVGTSCQVAGLLNFLRKPYENLFTIDLVCHGVPSPKLFAKYIAYLKETRPYFDKFSFRDTKGWSCNSSSSRLPSGKMVNEVMYGVDFGYFSFFINGYMNRECCYACPYAKTTPRIGDITLADFWGIGKTREYRHDTRYGVSFVSTNTIKGVELFDAIKSEIEYEERDVMETIEDGDNAQLARPSRRPAERDGFYKNAYAMPWKELVKYYGLPLKKKRPLYRRILSKVKRMIIR